VMGNQASAVQDLLKQIETSATLGDIRRLIQLVPYWQPAQEGRHRELHDFESVKLLPNVLAQLGRELGAVNISAREYNYESDNVGDVLHVIDVLLSAKAIYKQLPKQDLSVLTLALQASIRRRDDDIALQASNTIRVVIERVGFRERKAGKEHRQVSREADAKARIINDGGLVDVLIEACAYFHPRTNPLVVDAVLRLALSLLCTHQDTTPFAAVTALHGGLSSQVSVMQSAS
jgi:hypothetical protein